MIGHAEVKLYHLKPQTLKNAEIIKVSDKPTCCIIGKLLTWRSQILIIIMIGHAEVKLYHLKPQTLKHV